MKKLWKHEVHAEAAEYERCQKQERQEDEKDQLPTQTKQQHHQEDALVPEKVAQNPRND
jgi:hypothetical protein